MILSALIHLLLVNSVQYLFETGAIATMATALLQAAPEVMKHTNPSSSASPSASPASSIVASDNNRSPNLQHSHKVVWQCAHIIGICVVAKSMHTTKPFYL